VNKSRKSVRPAVLEFRSIEIVVGVSIECHVIRLLSLCLSSEGARTIGERQEPDAAILAHYEEGVERERLLRGGAGNLEYLRTRELLARYLPPVPATVLDVGGGAGVYALPLARQGYSVHLIAPNVAEKRTFETLSVCTV
jgi:hypothetical protein